MSKARLVITAVLIEGRSQSQVARDYGVSQSWISRLIKRYTAEGEAAFEPRSRRPHITPQRLPQPPSIASSRTPPIPGASTAPTRWSRCLRLTEDTVTAIRPTAWRTNVKRSGVRTPSSPLATWTARRSTIQLCRRARQSAAVHRCRRRDVVDGCIDRADHPRRRHRRVGVHRRSRWLPIEQLVARSHDGRPPIVRVWQPGAGRSQIVTATHAQTRADPSISCRHICRPASPARHLRPGLQPLPPAPLLPHDAVRRLFEDRWNGRLNGETIRDRRVGGVAAAHQRHSDG